jgi:hypothetical protein
VAFKQTNSRINAVDISPNGRYTAFTTAATNWVTFDSNLLEDIYVYDNLNPGSYRVATVNSTGLVVEKDATNPTSSILPVPEYISVSDAGTVIYTSDSKYLDPPNSVGSDVFVHCTSQKATRRIAISHFFVGMQF